MRGSKFRGLVACSAAASLLLVACGGGGGAAVTPPPVAQPPPAVSKTEAFRFLNQATFGATEADSSALIALGDSTNAYTRWVDAQLAGTSIGTQLPYVEAAYPSPVPQGFNVGSLHAQRLEAWFKDSLNGGDQLRQRVAWALSEIMVVSQIGALQNYPFAVADFYDMLARDAFGNFRQLMEDVTLHPAMGIYLSMLGNQKANVATNIRPDENYARELMQLFTVGLVQLNLDGSVKPDGAGQPIPTYDQSVVEGFARVYTGWKWACPTTRTNCTFANTRAELAPVAGYNQVKAMQFFAEAHETGTKQLLDYAGALPANGLVPANQPGAKDLQDALDNIFNHPNVGPFVARQLIQKLVTSNPGPAYVQRVAQKFNDDGTGKRGNLAAVVRAILLDDEARSAPASANAGKLKEPILRVTQFWRAYAAKAASGKYVANTNFAGGPAAVLGEAPQQSPSVFNFFSPGYAPPGEIANGGLVAPELQLATEYQNTQVTNFFWTYAINRTTAQTNLTADQVFIDTREESALAADPEGLINRVGEKLLGGAANLSPTLKLQAKAQIERSAATGSGAATRVADAIYFVVTSPDFALQR
jgi:uncharacterized protein (DUF1800 family)